MMIASHLARYDENYVGTCAEHPPAEATGGMYGNLAHDVLVSLSHLELPADIRSELRLRSSPCDSLQRSLPRLFPHSLDGSSLLFPWCATLSMSIKFMPRSKDCDRTLQCLFLIFYADRPGVFNLER